MAAKCRALRTARPAGTRQKKYNHLNLPVAIEFLGGDKKITYIYNASGVKLQKRVLNQPSVVITDYVGGFQYRNNVLQFFSTAEGYVANTVIDSVNHYNYVYHYKDHLGNIRMSYGLDENRELKILEENHYYPYGLKHSSYNSQRRGFKEEPEGSSVVLKIKPPGEALSSDYNYKFNGMEFQDELGLNLYDMDMRDYDPAIGRWTGIDPVTHHSQSPYNAFDGNPVFWADPSGADGVGAGGIFTNAYGVANYQGYNGYNTAMSNHGAFNGGYMSVADEMGGGIFSTSNLGEIAAIGNSLGLWSVSNIWVPGREGHSGFGEAVVYSGHWETVREPPVNLFGIGDGVNFHKTFANQYKKFANTKGDGIFRVYGHGHWNGVWDDTKSAEGTLIRTAKGFDKMMAEKSPEWSDAIKNQKNVILILYTCTSASAENSIAKKISNLHKNVTVVGFNGYVTYNNGTIEGVNKVSGSGDKNGEIVIFRGGKEIHRDLYRN